MRNRHECVYGIRFIKHRILNYKRVIKRWAPVEFVYFDNDPRAVCGPCGAVSTWCRGVVGRCVYPRQPCVLRTTQIRSNPHGRNDFAWIPESRSDFSGYNNVRCLFFSRSIVCPSSSPPRPGLPAAFWKSSIARGDTTPTPGAAGVRTRRRAQAGTGKIALLPGPSPR